MYQSLLDLVRFYPVSRQSGGLGTYIEAEGRGAPLKLFVLLIKAISLSIIIALGATLSFFTSNAVRCPWISMHHTAREDLRALLIIITKHLSLPAMSGP